MSGHNRPEQAVTFKRNGWSRWRGIRNYLLAAEFDGPIICSQPSALLLPEILEDALKSGFTRNRALINQVLDLIRSRLVPVPYDHWHPVFEAGDCSLSVRLQRAGHILGSAYVECQADTGAASERVVFSGDLGSTPCAVVAATGLAGTCRPPGYRKHLR